MNRLRKACISPPTNTPQSWMPASDNMAREQFLANPCCACIQPWLFTVYTDGVISRYKLQLTLSLSPSGLKAAIIRSSRIAFAHPYTTTVEVVLLPTTIAYVIWWWLWSRLKDAHARYTSDILWEHKGPSSALSYLYLQNIHKSVRVGKYLNAEMMYGSNE